MSVSRRLRFEVFTRDGHTCRYCGATAPDVVLTVDHVLPVALGGRAEPTNLVTACKDCNAGKSSVQPGSAIVDDVEADAFRWARARRFATTLMAHDTYVTERECALFDQTWSEWSTNGMPAPRPDTWAVSIEQWLWRGLPLATLLAKIPAAMGANVPHSARWRYFCGIAWNLAADIDRRAIELIASEDEPDSVPMEEQYYLGHPAGLPLP